MYMSIKFYILAIDSAFIVKTSVVKQNILQQL